MSPREIYKLIKNNKLEELEEFMPEPYGVNEYLKQWRDNIRDNMNMPKKYLHQKNWKN